MAIKPVEPPAGHRTSKVSADTAQLEALFASIGEGIVATNSQGHITRVNQAGLAMLGFRRRDVLHKHFPTTFVAVHDNGKPVDIMDRPIMKAIQTGQTISARTYYLRKDGSLLPVQLTVSPILLHKRPIGAIEVYRDLTGEIENDKLKSDFISIASHQLRTPLSAINMYTRMLQGGLAGDLTPEQLPYVQTILSSVERMNVLIDTLLNITRIEAGGIAIKLRDVRLDDLAREILAEFLPTARAKSVELTADIPESLPVFRTDSLLVKEICANLLSNAIKYTPPDGTVHLSLSMNDKEVRFSVADNGYGIPAAAQKNIFLKFFRAENILHRDVSGTGLGLYLIKNIAESLGGELWFESRENVGSTFYFTLPRT
jgi:PAS domain S-box-containing protein